MGIESRDIQQGTVVQDHDGRGGRQAHQGRHDHRHERVHPLRVPEGRAAGRGREDQEGREDALLPAHGRLRRRGARRGLGRGERHRQALPLPDGEVHQQADQRRRHDVLRHPPEPDGAAAPLRLPGQDGRGHRRGRLHPGKRRDRPLHIGGELAHLPAAGREGHRRGQHEPAHGARRDERHLHPRRPAGAAPDSDNGRQPAHRHDLHALRPEEDRGHRSLRHRRQDEAPGPHRRAVQGHGPAPHQIPREDTSARCSRRCSPGWATWPTPSWRDSSRATTRT